MKLLELQILLMEKLSMKHYTAAHAKPELMDNIIFKFLF